MKCRAVAVIDYDLPGGYRDAAIEEEALQKAIDELVKGNPKVVYSEIDMKERRGNNKPDIKKMKFRTS
jgi:hypothetical protein|tara:strand:+ start:296 stop:499 length:204 start_codon:yes stop_codon:yes gene_type:complete